MNYRNGLFLGLFLVVVLGFSGCGKSAERGDGSFLGNLNEDSSSLEGTVDWVDGVDGGDELALAQSEFAVSSGLASLGESQSNVPVGASFVVSDKVEILVDGDKMLSVTLDLELGVDPSEVRKIVYRKRKLVGDTIDVNFYSVLKDLNPTLNTITQTDVIGLWGTLVFYDVAVVLKTGKKFRLSSVPFEVPAGDAQAVIGNLKSVSGSEGDLTSVSLSWNFDPTANPLISEKVIVNVIRLQQGRSDKRVVGKLSLEELKVGRFIDKTAKKKKSYQYYIDLKPTKRSKRRVIAYADWVRVGLTDDELAMVEDAKKGIKDSLSFRYFLRPDGSTVAPPKVANGPQYEILTILHTDGELRQAYAETDVLPKNRFVGDIGSRFDGTAYNAKDESGNHYVVYIGSEEIPTRNWDHRFRMLSVIPEIHIVIAGGYIQAHKLTRYHFFQDKHYTAMTSFVQDKGGLEIIQREGDEGSVVLARVIENGVVTSGGISINTDSVTPENGEVFESREDLIFDDPKWFSASGQGGSVGWRYPILWSTNDSKRDQRLNTSYLSGVTIFDHEAPLIDISFQ